MNQRVSYDERITLVEAKDTSIFIKGYITKLHHLKL